MEGVTYVKAVFKVADNVFGLGEVAETDVK